MPALGVMRIPGSASFEQGLSEEQRGRVYSALRLVIKKERGTAEASLKLGRKDRSYVSRILTGNTAITERVVSELAGYFACTAEQVTDGSLT